ncbi:TetR/AcrR family transcriptional regulator [Dyella flagellata]|uniref:TetR family transcriptional regulator n=1 Tax=Dyella flagellata TaxID=1867833 RepID=A0ABQ5XH34_9GAMM|nr:TetR/AcrR family transcriptional regulator [Dyella flagellata]GLQ89764.1 TetR family transcriptional regulator [Dyella flagellata]
MLLTEKAKATRQQILDAGMLLVLRKGFVGTGLQEILQTSGVPKGSFYHYFPSKEDFGCALLQQYADDYRERLNAILAPGTGSGRDRLMCYWQAWLEASGQDPWGENCLVVKLAAEVSDLSESMRCVLNAGVEELQARIAAVISEGREDGSLPSGASSLAVARVLYQMWLGAALLAKLGQNKAPLQHAMLATEHLLACDGTVTSSTQD